MIAAPWARARTTLGDMDAQSGSVLVALREGTAAVHAAAERHAFVRELFGPSPSRPTYVRYLGALAHVYDALEASLRARRDDVGILADPRLARAEAVRADLGVLGDDASTSTAACRYVARIGEVAGDLPRLAAHAYVRYLGDLAGGQVMGKRVQAAFGSPEHDVSRMYRFSGFASTREAASLVREELARIGTGEAAREAMVTEAVRAFDLTTALFGELVGEGWSAV